MVFEKRGLKIKFGPKRNKVTGSWRKLHNEELHNLYSSSSVIRMIKLRRVRWTGQVPRIRRSAYRILVGKLEGKRPLGRPRRRWVDNIEIDLRERGGVVWTGLIWLRIRSCTPLL
jgi:hypothetical protein